MTADKYEISNIDLDTVTLPGIAEGDYAVSVLRIDKIHPQISGNKWFKLKYNLIEAKNNGYKKLLTFGGAFSNHIYAVAAAGKEFGFETIGIIRGEEYAQLNPTLAFASACGMKLHYLDRSTYKNRNEKFFQDELKIKFENPYVIPEGGTNQHAIKGTEEIVNFIRQDFDFIATACGTGGTIAGIISSLKGEKKVIGFPALKGGEYLRGIIENLVYERTNNNFNNWELITDFHFGGYAKIDTELINFVNEFESINNLKLDYIYTSKMFYGICQLLKSNCFEKGSKIVLIHTGGLQGNEGMKTKIKSILKSKLYDQF